MASACGISCEVCGIRERIGCPLGDGCVAGTDSKAAEKAQQHRAVLGQPCAILECAIKNGVDYCTRCSQYPCDIYYQSGPFKPEMLDMIRDALKGK
jgi:hypothetical protein